MSRIPFTPEGFAQLKEELEYLMHTKRLEVARAIEEARSHGDLSENAEFKAAREEKALIERNIADLQRQKSLAEIIDVTLLPKTGRVVFGTTVTLKDLDIDKSIRLKIVGDYESNIQKGKLSCYAPLARAVIGHPVGDTVSVETPSGMKKYSIQSIEYI